MTSLRRFLQNPWTVAFAGSFTGSLLGIALGVQSWAFFAGCSAGAILTAVGLARLRSKRLKKRSPLTKEPSPPYDLETDRSTDNQRWPM